MTTDTSDFTGLITSEHQNASKFVQTVSASVQGFSDNIAVAAGIPDFLDLDQAVGYQLDTIGIWVGVSRLVALSVNQYFSLDTDGVGVDQGIWWEVGDALTTVTQLADAQYRTLIRAKIACNSWDGSLPGACSILALLVSADGCTVSASEGSMSVDFSITGTPAVVTKAIILGGYIPIKPAGISVTYSFASSS